MWQPCPEPHSSKVPTTNRAPLRHPSETSDARRRATVHRFSRFFHAHPHTQQYIDAAARFHSTSTLTEILLIAVVVLRVCLVITTR